ncbi:hypothetical protein KSS82_04730 [Vibrio mimicus]|nr:hypothetical protein [Vibrio mimicus]QXC55599.1 hypothetical protein KSS82_04730 [Vibrio mimicus]
MTEAKVINVPIHIVDPVKNSIDLMVDKLSVITEFKLWYAFYHQIIDGNYEVQNAEFSEAFHKLWTISGHHIREQINDDKKLLQLLSKFLPPYKEESILLFRGEALDSYNKQQIGFCWTPVRDKAEQFACGLNAVGSGGILLSCECQSNWILSSPSEHSKYLGEYEYTVNPFLLENVIGLTRFPALGS